jgi:hypothetical protein
MQFAWKLGVLMLVALAILVLPGGGGALNVVLSALTIAFLAAIAVVGYRLYRQYQLDIESLEPNVRLVLYGSVGGAVLTFVATNRLVNDGIGILVWFALLALCSYGLYWVWTQWRKYT